MAEFVPFLLPVPLTVWTAWDANNRGANPLAWAVGVYLFAIIFFPWYLTRRPLMVGEERRGGLYWNVLKNLAIFWTVLAAILAIFTSFDAASEAPTAEDAAVEVVGVVLAVGVLWFILVGVSLGLGFVLRKPWVIERGPTGPLAQETGNQPTEPRTPSYLDNTRNSGNEEHQDNYGGLALAKEIVDLSPQQLLDEAQTFLVRQGYGVMHRRGESLTMQRQSSDQMVGQNTGYLTVTALSQPGGGVRINVGGNDPQGVTERLTAWTEWYESLPKKQELPTQEEAGERRFTEDPLDAESAATKDRGKASNDPSESHGAQGPNVYEQIRHLAELRDEGLLTSEEFEAKKRDLLDRL